jgi:hypothetical protein
MLYAVWGAILPTFVNRLSFVHEFDVLVEVKENILRCSPHRETRRSPVREQKAHNRCRRRGQARHARLRPRHAHLLPPGRG